eukprot:Seg2176.3 transcript_id=Seg2176.3/GoldUCD/mRNA.D3Y31 product="Mediator of RNA polymerase II transcription subunit 9" protein_id=Seg2176.3/GoldUCD/D3Y31
MNQAGGAAGYPSLIHELNLIPMVLELVEIIQNCGDQQEINRRVANFRAKLQTCRELVNKLPGLEMNVDEQEKELQVLRAQLKSKQELLEKFSNLEALAANIIKKEAS